MNNDPLPEADRAHGAPHPRQTLQLFGHDEVEEQLVQALSGDRLHHAWMLTGPKGVGKATLAWRMARFLLAKPATEGGLFADGAEAAASLDLDPDHPVARRVDALSEPGCLLIRREWDVDKKRFKQQITVDEVRKLNSFFGLSAAEGGHRVVIIDSADEMNASAANALLKVLEEPPKHAMILLISHQPARLLPTIRSRCRVLRLGPVAPDAMAQALKVAGVDTEDSHALYELAQGSVGRAVRLETEDGLTLYQSILDVIATAPSMDRQRLAKLAESLAARGAETRLDLAISLLDTALSRLARHAAGHPVQIEAAEDEARLFDRLATTSEMARTWAQLQQDLSVRIRHGRGVNIDTTSLLTDAFLSINTAAG